MSTAIFPVIIVAAAILGSYYLIIFLAFRKKVAATLTRTQNRQWVPVHQHHMSAFPHQLIDRPVDKMEDEATLSFSKETKPDIAELEMVDDEENVLLKAAEIVVEKIQDTVNYMAAQSPSQETIHNKIKSIVNQYQIFHNTEYFDAINSFIAITVERDCAIQFSKEQLHALWK